MTLNDADIGMEYKVRSINAEDEEMVSFLFSLGCYSGETIMVVSKKRSGVVVSIKDGRYNMDKELSSAIEIA